uniref:Uncharacterized protein n=1 Tax=Amorphochlora amoebiformis TaxID=1561963 RepID=A0A7S0H168_9EUKA|mmetsp:Transcript_33997/g.54733  ORF Transcript_33997/g.54733 Transcript_33997/m.54733 type:complete len:474 (+) Transcript_33997:78-1499(+)
MLAVVSFFAARLAAHHLSQKAYLTVGLAFLTVFISSGAGVGGGGILVPLYTLLLGAGRDAVPLSNATIFGASVINVILYGIERNPYSSKPLVAWDLILAMEPMTILGALVGSLLNKIAPTWFTSICLTLVLVATTFRMTRKAVKFYALETKEEERQAKMRQKSYGSFGELHKSASGERMGGWVEEKDTTDAPPALTRRASALSLTDATTFSPDIRLDEIIRESTDDITRPPANSSASVPSPLEKLLEWESRAFPVERILGVGAIFAVVIGLTIAKGGPKWSPFGVQCGSVAYWILSACVIPVVLIAFFIVRHHLMSIHKEKEMLYYRPVKGDVQWTARNTLIYPAICAFAGIFAGLFGIGGGIVKGPLMIEMGVLPEVAVATSSTMIFFTTGAATASFLVLGTLPKARAMAFFSIGLAAGLMGQLVMTRVIRSLARPSILIFAISGIIGLSAILMTWASIGAIMAGHGAHDIC